MTYTSALIVLSVVFASAMILTVYVTLGTRVEASVVKRQTAYVVHTLLGDTDLLGDTGNAALKSYLASLRAPDLSKEDAQSAAMNKQVLFRAFKWIAVACVVGLLLARRLSGPYFGQVVKQASISAVLAGATEAAFLLCIGQLYISADPNAVKLMILEQLQDMSKAALLPPTN